ncbi:MAG: 1-acyl-sn-glycerol-3-phosphate acyltransferase [Psychrobium sp.]|nr:1-acyl-sn-glycerol-3-phosphate acyltransferase [Psychrobium sp.]
MSYLVSSIYFIWVTIVCIIFFPISLVICIITKPFDRRLVALNYFSHFWGSLFLWSNPYWSMQVSGREKIDKSRPYVIVSNHLSTVDVVVISGLFVHFKWVSKIENFKIPFLGWSMHLNNYVAIRRGGISSIKSMIKHSKRHLDNGSSIFIFPEGSRSDDGKIQSFKTGAFKIAKEMNVAIVPIALTGTEKALQKNSLMFKGHQNITMSVLDIIEPSEYQELSLKQLTKLAQQRITDSLESNKEY